MKINEKTFHGSIGFSNPVVEAYSEAEQMNRDSGSTVALVLSIESGTIGSMSRPSAFKLARYYSIARALARWSENTHHTMSILASRRGLRYNRFNVDEGLEKIKIDDWKGSKKSGRKTLEKIQKATLEYLQQADIEGELRELAAILVENRQLRSRSPNWKRFCMGVT